MIIMRSFSQRLRPPVASILALAGALSFGALSFGAAPALADEEGTWQGEMSIGGQGRSVDGARASKLETYRDETPGFTLDGFHLVWTGTEYAFSADADHAGRRDERYLLRASVGRRLRLRASYSGIPYRFGDDATFVLDRVAPDTFRIADFIQRQLEDPDGNGVPFFSEPGGVSGDNLLAQGLMRQLLGSREPFDVDSRRRTGRFALNLMPAPRWNVGVEAERSEREGMQPLGSGSYQRITDVDGDGRQDYDYFFSVRGIELPAPIDTATSRTSASVRYRADRWFAGAQFEISDFDNDFRAVTYDNPFWFTDTLATSGIRRGLWEQGRTSLPPSNQAWNLATNAGIDLAGRTRLTFHVAIGKQTQDEPFVPITTNTALIATADINGDGLIDAADDPTSSSVLPKRDLGGSVDTTSIDLAFTSRPSKKVKLSAKVNYWDYDAGEESFQIPVRADYIESRLSRGFHDADLLHLPYAYSRLRTELEAAIDLGAKVCLVPFFHRVRVDRNQYRDFDGGAFDRDFGNRAVERTDDDIYGASLRFKPSDRISGRLEYRNADRSFDGDYQVGFKGELEELRQFDIANRDRDQVDLQLDFLPRDEVTVGFSMRFGQDDYPDSEFGLLAADDSAIDVTLGWALRPQTSLNAWAGWSEFDADMHLRTKCSNCTPPPGAAWSAPWGVPNFDWFTDYTDQSLAVGVGVDHSSANERVTVHLEVSYQDAEITQRNHNPDVPRDLGLPGQPAVQVAQAFDFPDQQNDLVSANIRVEVKLNERYRVGFRYLFEDYGLDDFQWDNLTPYGADFLAVDDATRYLFLDARYSDYTTNVGGVYLAWHW